MPRKSLAVVNEETGETQEQSWTRKSPKAVVGEREYMMARVENEGEQAQYFVIVHNTSLDTYTILTRQNGQPVKMPRPSHFQVFIDALTNQ